MPRGRLPTVIVATTLLVCGEMTESVLATSLLTYSAGPAERAGRVSPIASRKGRAWVRLGDIAGFMRVYPIQSLKMAWSTCSAWSSPRRRSRPRIRLRIAPVKSAPVTSASVRSAPVRAAQANNTFRRFAGAALPGADLTDADVTGADFTGAILR